MSNPNFFPDQSFFTIKYICLIIIFSWSKLLHHQLYMYNHYLFLIIASSPSLYMSNLFIDQGFFTIKQFIHNLFVFLQSKKIFSKSWVCCSGRGAGLGCHFVSSGVTLWVCSPLRDNGLHPLHHHICLPCFVAYCFSGFFLVEDTVGK